MIMPVENPSPNEGKILRALQEATASMMGLIGKPMSGGKNPHRVPAWEGWWDLEEIADEIKIREWCRGSHWNVDPYIWSSNTIRAHLEKLVYKSWLEKKIDDGTRRALYRVVATRRTPLYEVEGVS